LEFFALLTVATLIIVVLAAAIYRRTRDLGIIWGIAALYYWSLYGAWFLVIDKSGGYSGKNYHYLEHKLFPISLDANYLVTLSLYAGFIIIVQVTLWASLKARKRTNRGRLAVRHEVILAWGFAAAIASIWLMGDKLRTAWALNMSAYFYTRSQTDEWFTLHQVLNRLALIPPAIGFALLLAGDRSRYFVSIRRRWTLPAYIALFAGMGVFTFILGNKNEVFTALIAGFLAWVNSVRRANPWKAAAVIAGGFWFLYTIDFFRSVPLTDLKTAVEQRVNEVREVGRFMASSNEAYGAHFSLYGVLATATEPRFGYSIYALACSVVPRVLWPDRPRDIYLYYSENVGALQNQGYSVHHATGWYLSFGYAGVALGALVMGLVWAHCYRLQSKIRRSSGLIVRLWAALAPWMFAAYVPPLVRAGPEGYKGFLLEAALIPVAVLALACRKERARRVLMTFPQPLAKQWNCLSSR
jgi:hypothetical protein